MLLEDLWVPGALIIAQEQPAGADRCGGDDLCNLGDEVLGEMHGCHLW